MMPIFLLAVLAASLVSLLIAASSLGAGRFKVAGRILLCWGMGGNRIPGASRRRGASLAPEGIETRGLLLRRRLVHEHRKRQQDARAERHRLQAWRADIQSRASHAAKRDGGVGVSNRSARPPVPSRQRSFRSSVRCDAQARRVREHLPHLQGARRRAGSFFTGDVGIVYASFIVGNGDLIHKPRVKYRIQ
jgi:hypothetical protein